MPPITKRVGIYDRISSEMQIDNHSLDAQERLARKYAEDRGWSIVQVYTDEAISGTHDRRPQFQQMIADVQAGLLDVVIVYKLDRFARNVEHANKYMKILLGHNVTFVSITEGFDATTAMGKMQMNIMATIAEWYSDNLSTEYKKGKRERIAKGLWNGDPPFGYRRTEGKVLEPDPADAAGVQLAYREYATGLYSDNQIAQLLNANGYRTANKTGRRPFSKDTVREMLKNRFYLGLVSYKGAWGQGQHPALIDEDTFDRAHIARGRQTKRHMTAPMTPRVYPLSGLLYCEACGLRYRGRHDRYGRHYWKPASDYGITCIYRPTVRATVEDQLAQIIGVVKLPGDWEQEVLARLSHRLGHDQELDAKRARLESQLERASQLFYLGDWTQPAYTAERTRLHRDLETLHPIEQVDVTQAGKLLRDFGDLFQNGNLENRKRLLNTMLEKVFLEGDEICAITPRRELYPLMFTYGGGPDGGPVRGWHTDSCSKSRLILLQRAEPYRCVWRFCPLRSRRVGDGNCVIVSSLCSEVTCSTCHWRVPAIHVRPNSTVENGSIVYNAAPKFFFAYKRRRLPPRTVYRI
jgi:site-specific DNA recombinase